MRLVRPGIVLAFLAFAVCVGPVAAALPDPADAGRFDSPCALQNDRHFVYDFVGLLDEAEGALVEDEACELYQEDGAHLVLAIVPGLDGESIDAYALDLVRGWGIGDAERLDGLLVLYALDDGTGSGSGAVRIEVGYGLESTVNSLVAREAVDSMAALKRSLLENGSTDSDATSHALASGAAGLALFTRSNLEGQAGAADSPGFVSTIPWWVWLVVALVVLSVVLGGGRSRGGGGLRPGGGFGGPPMGGGFGGGRRGGGSGGFGGGKSGGGGWGGKL
jgi:uncharacterized protein